MPAPAGPIYSSTLHRRDRVWGVRRRGHRGRLALALSGLAALTTLLVQHFS